MILFNRTSDPLRAKAIVAESADQSFKFLRILSQEDIDKFASLCDGYGGGRWGDCSAWIVSRVSKAVKSGKATADQVWKYADDIRKDVKCFRAYKRELGGNIETFGSFDALHKACQKYIDQDGDIIPKIVTSRLSSRIRSALSKMKAAGMTKVLDNDRFYVSSPNTIEANRTMSPIGRWCHTGNPQSGTTDADYYWKEYTSYGPLYYVLDKDSEFVLCMSFARQKEIRNQHDMQPYETESGSGVWDVDITKDTRTGDKMVPYENTEKDWNSFMKWLDPTGELPKAILAYEDKYAQAKLDRMKDAFYADAAELRQKITNGVLQIDSDRTAKQLKKLLKADLAEMPSEDDFDGDSEDFEYAVEVAERNNQSNMALFKGLAPVIARFLGEIKLIRPGRFASRMFAGVDYDGQLPDVDMSGSVDANGMFSGFNGKTVPALVNCGTVQCIDNMFANCRKLEVVPDLVFPGVKAAYNVFRGSGAIKKVGALYFPNIKRGSYVIPVWANEIGDINIQSAELPLQFFQKPQYGYKSSASTIGEISFRPDAGLTESYNVHVDLIPPQVMDQFADKCGEKILSKLKKNKNGFVLVDAYDTKYGSPLSDAHRSLFVQKLVKGYDLTKADGASVINFLKSLTQFQFSYISSSPFIMLSQDMYEKQLNSDDFAGIVNNGKVIPKYSGRIILVDESGNSKILPDSGLEMKADSRGVSYDSDGYLLVRTPADARFAAKHHDQLDKIDITDFWDNARYEISFWIWIRNYLGDTESFEDVSDDNAYFFETKLPKIRMTQAQWDHRNDEGPIFEYAPNLKASYGDTCVKSKYNYGFYDDHDDYDDAKATPDFVEIAKPKISESKACLPDRFILECEALARRLRLGED